MNRTGKLAIMLCTATIFIIAACGAEQQNAAPETETSTAPLNETSTPAPATITPLAIDPCTVSATPGRMCRIVATAPIEDSATANPIAVAITTSPRIELLIGTRSGAIARHSVYPSSTSGSGGTGPSGDFITKQDQFLTSVTDVTGDGPPEIIVQTGQFPEHNEFQVLQLTNNGTLTIVPSPEPTTWATGQDVWALDSSTGLDLSYYRCAPGQKGVTRIPLEDIAVAADGSGTRTNYFHDNATATWTAATPEAVQIQMGVTTHPDTGFDCTDTSTRQPRTTADKNDPFTTHTPTVAPATITTSPANDTPMDVYTDSTTPATPGTTCGASTGRRVLTVVSGTISCADALAVMDTYRGLPLDSAHGNANIREFDGWNCASPTYVMSRELGYGSRCSKGDIDLRTPIS